MTETHMGEITIKKALADYKTIYMPYRNFADRTRVEYQNDLEAFIEFLGQSGISQVRELGLPIIERYAAHLEQKGFAGWTRKRSIVAIRSFSSFLYQESYIDIDIAKRIVLPLTESTIPYVLTQSECNKLREACADNLRDTAIIELILQTGITLSELVNLTVDDVQLGENERGLIRVSGRRRKKERLIPLNSKAYVALKDYFDVREQTENNVFFLNRFGEALGESGVQKMLRKYLKSAEIGKASIHTLRHTFGAHHIAKGTSLKTIQEVMGLKDVRSTSVYQSLAKEVITREMQENSI